MFRKLDKKSKKAFRRKRKDDHEQDRESDGDVDDATGIAVRKTMKKQKILASMPLTSVETTLKNSNNDGSRVGVDQSLSGQKLSQDAATATASSAELSVLATKHMNNMEVFIEKQMAVTRNKIMDSAINGRQQKAGDKTSSIGAEEDLYQQLAREVTDTGDNNISGNINTKLTQEQPVKDGDQGDGGAALLVGTGIAEVILPATDHRPIAVPTSSRVWNKNNNLLSSAVPEKERHKHMLPKTTPKPFVKFRKSNNALSQNNDNRNSGNDNRFNNIQASAEETMAIGSTTRKGFDAFRGKTPASNGSNDEDNGSNDWYKNKNNKRKIGKDRDDQVYSHFLKNALNGKSRR